MLQRIMSIFVLHPDFCQRAPFLADATMKLTKVIGGAGPLCISAHAFRFVPSSATATTSLDSS